MWAQAIARRAQRSPKDKKTPLYVQFDTHGTTLHKHIFMRVRGLMRVSLKFVHSHRDEVRFGASIGVVDPAALSQGEEAGRVVLP